MLAYFANYGNKIMKDKKLYKQITGKEIKNHTIIKHKILTYIDDTQHLITSKTHEDFALYIQDLHEILISVYR